MAIMLYRKGESHTIQGVQCDIMRCDLKDMPTYLEQGWVNSPEDLKTKKKAKPKEENPEVDADDPKGE